ncbi:hypothetical protein [uncultured Brevundimonas sp.]|uniref:hypothetical protein n=1 Tax=uncultured Brevundimonas sp. TaxID=213418 RepID=UPI0013789E99|nr:hypothetical protein [uncultured Brevundimonas sp.]
MAIDTLSAPELSIRESYLCMAHFLETYWDRGGRSSEELAGLLGGLPLSPDGVSADPAMMGDWLDAVAAVTGKGPSKL